MEELQDRLDRVQDAWNALPQEERFRLMPDASPKSVRGQAWTRSVNGPPDEEPLEESFRPGTLSGAARAVRESAYVRQCLALADWVGAGRESTQAGLLRPAVAREAYQELDLWPWERELDRRRWARTESMCTAEDPGGGPADGRVGPARLAAAPETACRWTASGTRPSRPG